MDMREWIIVLAIILMVVLAADAWRRVKRQQKYRGHYQAPDVQRRSSDADIQVKRVAARDERSVAIEARTRQLQLTEKVPMLVDSVETEAAPELSDEEPATEQFAFELHPPKVSANPAQQPSSSTAASASSVEQTDEAFSHAVAEPLDYAEADESDDDDELVDVDAYGLERQDEPGAFTEQLNDAWVDDLTDSSSAANALQNEQETDYELPEPQWDDRTERAVEPGEQMLAEPEAVMVITVLARDDYEFTGAALLEILLACGMRFGNMNIFHATDEQGLLQYSAANAFNPGTFDIDNVEHFATRGVTFFLQLPCQSKALDAFEAMYHTARTLGEHLQGDLYDDSRSMMTAQTLEHYRERIRDFQRTQLVKRV